MTGDKIKIKFTPTIASASYYIALSFPNRNKTAISWHRIPRNAEVGKELVFNIGKFEGCGFYDYKIVRLNTTNIENIQNHRFIVHNRTVKHSNIHEIVVDLFRAEKNSYTGALEGRGNLTKIVESLDYFVEKGVDTLYISGIHKRAHDDPYSVASRTKIEEEIGGEKGFKDNLIPAMNDKGMKLIVDFFDRIGSIHLAKKYRKLLVNYIDSQRNFVHFHGANGKSNLSFGNTSILNYRKKEAWDLLTQEAIEFVRKYGVDGLHLDN